MLTAAETLIPNADRMGLGRKKTFKLSRSVSPQK